MNRISAHLHLLLSTIQYRLEERNDRGATAVEYGLLVGLIAIVIIAGVTLLGTNLNGLFTNISGKLTVVGS